MTFTPAPWLVARIEPYEEDPSSPPFCQILAGGLDSGHGFEVHGVMSEPDARLIAAAPELFDALVGLLVIPKIAGCKPISGDLSWRPFENVFSKAKAALAKARGAGTAGDRMTRDLSQKRIQNRDTSEIRPQISDMVERVARTIERAWSRNHASIRSDPDIAWKVWTPEAEAALEASHHAELVGALRTARDMLLERVHGSPARSAAHNARVVIESALAKIGGDA